MARCVGQLVLVVLGRRVSQVERLLEGVGARHIHLTSPNEGKRSAQRNIHTVNLHLAIVGHAPHIHRWEGHNLVLHLVIIGIHRQGEAIEPIHRAGTPRQPHVVLRGIFRTQSGVARAAVIKVVEGGHTERILVEGTQVECLAAPRPPRQGEGGGKMTAVVGRYTRTDFVGRISTSQIGQQMPSAPSEVGIQGRQRSQPHGVGTVINIVAQGVDKSILCQREGHVWGGLPTDSGRSVILILTVHIHLTTTLVLHIGILVTVPCMVVFGPSTHLPLGREMFFVSYLGKEILVPQAFTCRRVVEDDTARQSALRPIEIALSRQAALIPEGMIEVSLHMPAADVGITSAFGRLCPAIVEGEGIDTVGTHVVALHHQSGARSHLTGIAQRRGDVSERTATHPGTPHVFFSFGKGGLLGAYAQDACRGIGTGRLEKVAPLPHGQREFLHIVQGKAPHVNLSGLRVAHRHSVVTHGRMGRSKASHRHGLQSPDAAIVAHSDSGKALHGIGHTLCSQSLQLLAPHGLHRLGRSHRQGSPTRLHRHLVNRVQGINYRLGTYRNVQQATQHQQVEYIAYTHLLQKRCLFYTISIPSTFPRSTGIFDSVLQVF